MVYPAAWRAVSFGFVVASLLSLRADGLHPAPRLPRGRGQLRAGLRYAERVPAIIRPLLMMALAGTFWSAWPASSS